MPVVRVVREFKLGNGRLPPGELTVEDAALWLGVSDETVRRYIAMGKIVGARRVSGAHGRQGWRWMVPTGEANRLKSIVDRAR